MKIKEFEALNLKECLQQVRQEMGPEAVILETRKFRKGGVMGWGAKDAVKIAAATGVQVQDPPVSKRQVVSGERQASGAVISKERGTPPDLTRSLATEKSVELKAGGNSGVEAAEK